MMQVNQNNPIEVRRAGYAALNEALGPVGAVRFLQQFTPGSDDYTKEKYEREDISPEEAEALMEGFNRF
ncbi:MAG: hypothetical protein LUE63_04190 [Lachnospiraceae bacterium]|nr:hypothetical protein [Lachnospiraceae bacterium]